MTLVLGAFIVIMLSLIVRDYMRDQDQWSRERNIGRRPTVGELNAWYDKGGRTHAAQHEALTEKRKIALAAIMADGGWVVCPGCQKDVEFIPHEPPNHRVCRYCKTVLIP